MDRQENIRPTHNGRKNATMSNVTGENVRGLNVMGVPLAAEHFQCSYHTKHQTVFFTIHVITILGCDRQTDSGISIANTVL